jgi:hypothetical protein
MKMYNNGPRKAMMYGGAAKRKPMMYGGMSKKRKDGKKGPIKSGGRKKDFAALAPPYDKATQADFIAGATGIVRDSKGNPVRDREGKPVRSN